MVAEWRQAFASPLLPWFTVQLAPYWSLPPGPQDIPIGTQYPHIRMAQAKAMLSATGSLSGYAVTHDLGDHAGGIHPHNKTEVGRRLAMPIRRLVFNATDVWNAGVPSTATDAFVTSGTLHVVFNTSGGVTWGPTQNCTTCCISSPNTTFAGATLEVAGADMSDWTLLPALTSSVGQAVEAKLPVGVSASNVRYAWSNYPQCVLFDAQQLPVPPFKLAVRQSGVKYAP